MGIFPFSVLPETVRQLQKGSAFSVENGQLDGEIRQSYGLLRVGNLLSADQFALDTHI